MAIGNSNQRPQLGVSPKLPKKVMPGSGRNTDGTLDYKFVLSEEEKKRDDYFNLKRLVYHYEWIGRQQINRHRDDVLKKFNLAYGIIDVDDYVKDDSEYNSELELMGGEPFDYDLKFYPIIPNIVNTLTSELGKHYIQYNALAVNQEASNMIIEEKNNLLRQLLLEPLQEQFNAQLEQEGISPDTQPDIYQQRMQMFKQMPIVQKYMAKEYRLEVENWANHTLQYDDKRFKMKDIEKQAFFNKIVTDLPFIHVNYFEDDYKIDVLDPRYCAYLRTPYADDISESIMFMWHEYESPLNLITRFGVHLDEEDIEKLKTLHIHYKTLLTTESPERYNMDTPGILESAQNFLAFREMGNSTYQDSKYRGGEYKERLVEVCNMYLQVPRKLGKLTVASDSEKFTTIVDETYKVNIKPVYDTTYSKKKDSDTLLYGEHIEWFYINELWRVVKINLSTNPNPDNSDDIWVTLEKFPIQLSKPPYQFGSYIPVHGGPKTNRYNEITTLVDKCKPWQVFYNYLWNRNDQLIKGEIGKFFAINQNVIPQESMGEEWGRHNILKFALSARDTKFAPIDTSLSNSGQTNLGISGGYGQVIDLSVTQEVLEKAQLAERCKNECLLQVGASPQLLGDISPSETATGVQQGIQRSVTQLKYLYDEHFSTFEKVRQTMLEFSRFIDITKGSVKKMYINDEGERVIFNIPSDLALHQLGVFVSSNIEDSSFVEVAKQLTINDNTLGADLLEKLSVLSSKSVSEIFSKLKDASIEKEIKEQNRVQQEQQLVQQQIESQERQLQERLKQESIEKQLDRESEERQTEMKVIGQAQFSEGGGLEPLLKLKEIQAKEEESYRNHLLQLMKDRNSAGIASRLAGDKKNAEDAKQNIEKEKINLEREKIAADLKKSQNDVLIAKTNRNKYSK